MPMVKITGGQRIDLLGISKEKLPEVWDDLGCPGPCIHKGCPHREDLRRRRILPLRPGDSTTLGIEIEKRFQGIEARHKIKMAASACPRNCAESTTKDVGVVAIEGGKWEVCVGGAAGARVRKGDVLCIVDTQAEVLK